MKVKFCGAAQHVTGSAHLLTLSNGFKILLDCGLYQGYAKEMRDFNENWLFDPAEIDCMVLSHAHIDHTGRIPKLVKDGFRGSIYCTHATRSLSAIMLADSAGIQERDAEYFNKRQTKLPKEKRRPLREPLYRQSDADCSIKQFVGMDYDRWFPISPDVSVLFKDAGHILGSASVTLKINDTGRKLTIGFSGDIGRPDRPILRDPQPMPNADYVICESTYGDKDHLGKPAEADKLLQIIKDTCLRKKGKLIIPAFSVGRTQELVYMLDQLETAGKLPRIPVYVDSPLAVNATRVFGAHTECFDKQMKEYMLIDDNPFGFNHLKYVHTVDGSKALNNKEASIIISSSGMANAGRVKHHIYNSINQKKNTVLIVGYCAQGTPGQRLRDGAEEIKLFGDLKPVNADVEVMDSFSAHADRGEMVTFLENQKKKAKKIFLVHGEIKRQTAFKELLREKGFSGVEIPALGDEFTL